MTLTSPLDKRGEASDDSYNETLRLLSEGSVHKHFDPYLDIDWDSPEFAVVPNDRRWILPAETDPLGAHPCTSRSPRPGRSKSACGARPMSRRSVSSSRTF